MITNSVLTKVMKFTILCGMYCILKDDISHTGLLSGAVCSGITVFLSRCVRRSKRTSSVQELVFMLRLLFLLLPNALKEAFLSSITVCADALQPKVKLNTKVITIRTESSNRNIIPFISWFITFTPGTLTLAIEQNVLKVHLLNCRGKNKNEERDAEYKIQRILGIKNTTPEKQH